MDNLAVRCAWADQRLLGDESLRPLLPGTIVHALHYANGPQYLHTVSAIALMPSCTDTVCGLYRPLMPEIFARWWKTHFSGTFSDHVVVLSCVARLFPFAPYLRHPVLKLLRESRFLSKLSSPCPDFRDLTEQTQQSLLLALFRLFSCDLDAFSHAVHPAFLSSLFTHQCLPLRVLAVQCFVQAMHLSDENAEQLMQKHLDKGAVRGSWETEIIDFRLLKLYEERRWKRLQSQLKAFERQPYPKQDRASRKLLESDFLVETAILGGVLMPQQGTEPIQPSTLVLTASTSQNLHNIGQVLLNSKPILITGQSGSGKTSLVHEAARTLSKMSSMITLHLNEQTDAKSLLGIYTTSSSGSFVWQPGVLVRAMQEGRWVLIEDVDRVPQDILGVIRPIVEKNELFLPGRKEYVKPVDGFRVLATSSNIRIESRSSLNHAGGLFNPRLWSVVNVLPQSTPELEVLLLQKFPSLIRLVPTLLSIHLEILLQYKKNYALKAVQSRTLSLRDLLKWCRRIQRRLASMSDTSEDAMPENIKYEIFKDGIDCYIGDIASETGKEHLASCIAEKLQVPPQQVQHCLRDELVKYSQTKFEVQIGRASLSKRSKRQNPVSSNVNSTPFAFTRYARRTMESIAVATTNLEPLLLVGETGIGKTASVQHLATARGQKLVAINLSQQSESTDLVGGLKPVTTRSLILPMFEKFTTLFEDTFSAKKNEKYQDSIRRCVNRHNWERLLNLWDEAIKMGKEVLQVSAEYSSSEPAVQANKRRKLATPKYDELRRRWQSFSDGLDQLRAQILRKDSSLAFSFVEGRLVQAVREGEWVLLDEINLATSETLDSITSLLSDDGDESPYLMLVEAGKVEKIVAHPNFRIFAAMNPATDTGKKDLAPGIRSRFTEIYVPPGDNDLEDLVMMIHAYLGPLLTTDKRAAPDLAHLYLEVKKYNEEMQLTDGAGEVPHFTLRSLVRCLLYVLQHAPTYGLRRALYEGFNMSFCTVLSRESELLINPLIDRHILASIRNIRSFMNQVPKSAMNSSDHVLFKHHLVPKGPLLPDVQPDYIQTPSVERNLVNLARAVSMQKFPILIQGPTSSGKTSMIEYLAKYTGHRFVRINNHEHTDLQEYLGSYVSGDDGRLVYREGVLLDALRHGHWIVLDELNLAPSDVLEALNRLLDDNRELLIPESQEVVRPHSGFMLFATQNPAGLYGGRKRLSRAFRNRFLELHFDDIPEDELEHILRERSKIPPSFCSQIVSVYKKLSLQRQSTRVFEQRNSFATLRDLFRWAARPADSRLELAEQGFMLLGERVRDATERLLVKAVLEETMKVTIREELLYHQSKTPLKAMSANHQNIVWTPSLSRLYVLVSKALENNEPVLLVGETGCGKTQVCQLVAEAFGKHLGIYNAHTNTETGDLIGSQRPTRGRAEHGERLREHFRQILEDHKFGKSASHSTIEDLIDELGQLDRSSYDADMIEEIHESIRVYRSLFEWADGRLVTAMREGEHFLLDEISLADDAVLERLNSVLEPARTILLAEKGSTDSTVVAQPGFQFLATMNPGGDYGKRELSAALRNRLTEIWVPQLNEDADVLPILQTKMISVDPEMPGVMLQFSKWFTATFQSSLSATVSLRSLLAWAGFVHQMRDRGMAFAMIHGAAMVYVDSLGANPAALLSTGYTDINHARRQCIDKLAELLGCSLPPIYDQNLSLEMKTEHLEVGGFRVNRSADVPGLPQFVFHAPTTLQNTTRILRALQMSRPILLEGNPGVGKTAIVSALAQATGTPLTRINLSDQTDLMDLFGADVPVDGENLGNFAWRDGPLLRAMQTGEWVLLDEMNLASQSVLEGLNSCLDHRKEVFVAELDRTFACHPGFTLFAAQNPHQHGGGRKGLPKSFVNRFTVVYADPFQRDDLITICGRHYPPDWPPISSTAIETMVDAVVEAQKIVNVRGFVSAGGPWEFNVRDLYRWLPLFYHCQELHPLRHVDTIISQRFRDPDQAKAIRSIAGHHLDHISLYHNLTYFKYDVGGAILKRRPTTPGNSSLSGQLIPTHLLPQTKATITAINENWPVILVGSSGSGKSSLIRSLASMSGARLVEIPLNADTDTMDLLGGFEQRDSQAAVVAVLEALKIQLWQLIHDMCAPNASRSTLTMVLDLYARCTVVTASLAWIIEAVVELAHYHEQFHVLAGRLMDLDQMSDDAKPGFVWNDGILVDALRQGSWVVLDNANLCNPAVLDRLNSLLEPDGQMVMSECHNGDDAAKLVKRHPEFRIFLTMNPRYGELSRAMRNRSLEIFLPPVDTHQEELTTPTYTTDSSIYRLRVLGFSSSAASPSLRAELISTTLDHASFADWDLLSDANLGNFESSVDGELAVAVSARRQFPTMFRESWEHDEIWAGLYDRPNSEWMPQRASLLLTNEPVLTSQSAIDEAFRQSSLQSFLLESSTVRRIVASARERSNGCEGPISTALERSLDRSRASMIKARTSIPAIAEFCEQMCDILEAGIMGQWLGSRDFPVRFPSLSYSSIQAVISFVRDILTLIQRPQVPEGLLQAYIQIGHDVAHALRGVMDMTVANSVQKLQGFAGDLVLNSGQSLQRMWPVWKPTVPSDLTQLNRLLQFEGIMARFDQAAFTLKDHRKNMPHLRKQLIEMYLMILNGTHHSQESAAQLETSLAQLLLSRDTESERHGCFKSSFEMLGTILALPNLQVANEDLQLVSILAERPCILDTDDCSTSPAAHRLSSTAKMAGLPQASTTWSAWRGTFSLRLIQQLSDCASQSLGQMSIVQEEVGTLAKFVGLHTSAISQSLIENVIEQARILLLTTLSSHHEILPHSLATRVSAVQPWVHSFDDFVWSLHKLDLIWPEGRDGQYFQEIWDKHLRPAVFSLATRSSEKPETIFRTGQVLINLSIASLKLFVPDQAYDPVLLPQAIKERHQNSLHLLQTRLAAQKDFTLNFSGQTTSLTIRQTEAELVRLGAEPFAPAVARPVQPELHLVQEEFSNLFRSIVMRQPEKILLAAVPGPWSDENVSIEQLLEEAESLQLTITRVIERLHSLNRAYDDLVKPVIWHLQCLSFGTDLIVAAEKSGLEAVPIVHHIAKMCPMLGGKPQSVLDSNLVTSRGSEIGNKILGLEHLALMNSVTVQGRIDSRVVQKFLVLVGDIYDEWKAQLAVDQIKTANKSRYYSYRGEDDMDEESERAAMAEIFHSFEQVTETDAFPILPNTTKYDAQSTAIRLAQIQRAFLAVDSDEAILEKHILRTMDFMPSYIQPDGYELSPVSPEDLLPGTLLQLHQKLSALHGADTCASMNIYSDGNIAEYQKLNILVQRICDKFQTISTAWPEHAIPLEVLTCCKELSKFRINDPLARVLTKTEKLYSLIDQWQAVTSREFTAAEVYDELCQLIVSWRRLELSSWSRLLSVERQRHDEDASAWYFILYEAVMRNPRQVPDGSGNMYVYADELAHTLENFLKTTTIGQFSARLRLLQSFERLVSLLCMDESSFLVIRDVLLNLLTHFRRYEGAVSKLLQDKGAELEKTVREQIKLASWKDTNINALRESARRSHNKLFRIVRKYRSLLAQSFQVPEGPGIAMGTTDLSPITILAESQAPENLHLAITWCQHHLHGWTSRPERFINSLGAAARMRTLYASRQTEFRIDLELKHFQEQLRTSIKELRRQTPSNLTPENKDLISQLKGVKQALLADTIKYIRHMGIKRDIGASELGSQSDCAKVLASVPAFNLPRHTDNTKRANDALHDLLDLMPHIRQAPADHADDVKSADIRRGASLLEGLLSVLIRQRKDVAAAEEQLAGLQGGIEKLRMFQDFETEIFVPRPANAMLNWNARESQLAWLPKILSVSCRILEVQSEHSNLDNSDVLDLLRRYTDEISGFVSRRERSPTLPPGLYTANDLEIDETVDAVLMDLQQATQQAMLDTPHAAFVLRQIIPWTVMDGTNDEIVTNGVQHYSLKQLDESTHNGLDQIFHVVERTSQDLKKMPKSNDTAGWLVQGYAKHGDSVRHLQMSQVSTTLENVSRSVVHLPVEKLPGAARLLTTTIPVFDQYLLVCRHALDYALAIHAETGDLSVLLARSFVTLAKDGFCGPQDDSADKQESGQIESGTGLGEGEGAEDISNDVGDDEDLSKLTGTKPDQKDAEEIEASKDAVDVNREDLEGQDQADAHTLSDEDGDNDSEQVEGSELDEETGSVDDLDPTAVDEKQWEGLNEEEGKELKDDTSKSQSQRSDDKTAAQQEKKKAADDETANGNQNDDEDDSSELDDQAQHFEHEDAEGIDSYVEKEDALDLPDEMQLNGEDVKENPDSDDDMDKLSDIDQKLDAEDEVPQNEDASAAEDDQTAVDQVDEPDDTYDMMEDVEAVGDDDEITEHQQDPEVEEIEKDHQAQQDDMNYDVEETGDGDNGDAGIPQEQDQREGGKHRRSDSSQKQLGKDKNPASAEETNDGDGEEEAGGSTQGGKREKSSSDEKSEALKRLGNILDRWYERRAIHAAEDNPVNHHMDDIEMADTDLEHIGDDLDQGNAQALGTATHDQAQTLDQNRAVLEETTSNDEDRIPKVDDDQTGAQETMAEQFSRLQTDTTTGNPTVAGAFIPDRTVPASNMVNDKQAVSKDQMDDQDQPLMDIQHLSGDREPLTSPSPFSSLWATLFARTQTLSMILTEQLRLILSPTTATKLRGDFRTGKRLNTKRIIPYVASNYKRDKIWMRRSILSKRNYQIMIALDDSKSMTEGGAGLLALETLAMTCTALSMLESGDLCVVSFGNEPHIRVAHPFGTPFTPDSGANVVSNFTFRQTATDVKKLVSESIALFQDARLKATSQSQSDLWQLQLIISDGICDDHDAIRRLVRSAKEDKIMIVFVVVDAINIEGSSSIMDLTQANFEPDESGEQKLVMRRYLDRFPFEYYLVVRDVRDLPIVLANALKGWFVQMVDVA